MTPTPNPTTAEAGAGTAGVVTVQHPGGRDTGRDLSFTEPSARAGSTARLTRRPRRARNPQDNARRDPSVTGPTGRVDPAWWLDRWNAAVVTLPDLLAAAPAAGAGAGVGNPFPPTQI